MCVCVCVCVCVLMEGLDHTPSLTTPCLHPNHTQKPVGFVRHLSIAGTAAAAGVLIYFWVQGQQEQQKEAARRAQRVERRL